MTTKPINKSSTVKAVDVSEKNLRTINELKDLKKFQDGTFKEPTPGTTLHRKKHPELYGYKYTSALERAAYPKAGTAPSEKQIIKWKLEESSKPVVRNPILKKAITDAEIQKKLDKLRGPSDWDMIYDSMSPHEKGSHNAEKRKQGMNGKTAEPLVKQFRSDSPDTYLSHPDQQKGMLLATLGDVKAKPKKTNLYADVKIPIPVIDHSLLRDSAADKARAAALEKTRVYAFSKIPDPDAVRGIGSFTNTIGEELRANNSKSDWEKRVNYKYKDNSNAKK